MPYILYSKEKNVPVILSEERPLDGSFEEDKVGLLEVSEEESELLQDYAKVATVVNDETIEFSDRDPEKIQLMNDIQNAQSFEELREITKKLI